MIVKSNSWHYKAYERWLERKKRNMPTYRKVDFEKSLKTRRLDLCSYTRIVLIFGPLRWFFQGYPASGWNVYYKKPGLVMIVILAGLATLLGVINHPLTYAEAGAAIVGFAGLLAVIFFLGMWVYEHQYLPRAKSAVSSSLVGEYAKARKKRICPFITIERSEGIEDGTHDHSLPG